MSKLLNLVYFPNELVCFSFKAKELFGKSVDKAGDGVGVISEFLLWNIQIKVITVHGFISGQAAGLRQLFHSRAESKTFDFFSQGSINTSCLSGQLLKTNSKEGASCSWRKVCDALCFAKNVSNVLRHVFGRLNTGAIRVNHLTVFPQSDFSAMCAYLNKAFIRLEKLKEISRGGVVILIMQPSRNPKGFTAFVSLWNRLVAKLTVVSAMRAGECI